MAISTNGGSNPTSVTYNGQNVTEVLYNGTHVWPDQPIPVDKTYLIMNHWPDLNVLPFYLSHDPQWINLGEIKPYDPDSVKFEAPKEIPFAQKFFFSYRSSPISYGQYSLSYWTLTEPNGTVHKFDDMSDQSILIDQPGTYISNVYCVIQEPDAPSESNPIYVTTAVTNGGRITPEHNNYQSNTPVKISFRGTADDGYKFSHFKIERTYKGVTSSWLATANPMSYNFQYAGNYKVTAEFKLKDSIAKVGMPNVAFYTNDGVLLGSWATGYTVNGINVVQTHNNTSVTNGPLPDTITTEFGSGIPTGDIVTGYIDFTTNENVANWELFRIDQATSMNGYTDHTEVEWNEFYAKRKFGIVVKGEHEIDKYGISVNNLTFYVKHK